MRALLGSNGNDLWFGLYNRGLTDAGTPGDPENHFIWGDGSLYVQETFLSGILLSCS